MHFPPFPDDTDSLLYTQAKSFGVQEALDRSASEPMGYAALGVKGEDASAFLHGQFTADIASLAVGDCATSALCNPKGRVIAQMDVARTDDTAFALVMPQTLVQTVTDTLSRYILRSKVTLGAWSDHPVVLLRATSDALAIGTCTANSTTLRLRPRWLIGDLDNVELVTVDPDRLTVDDTDHPIALAHVLAAIAPPTTHTALEHIPQMLNIDAFDGVSVTKGCYTGQEIIARVHHRGSVKRRLRRFWVETTATVAPGDPVFTQDGSQAGLVVESAAITDQRVGLLAVVKESAFAPDATLTCHDQGLAHWPLPYTI
ncbi:MAG: hypothetical protein AAF465_16365 [Pseudomonadota bacterium]